MPDVDQVEMAALQVWEASLCDSCRVEAKFAFDPSMTFLVDDHRCLSCRAVGIVQRDLQDKFKSAPQALDGLRFGVRPKLRGGIGGHS